jgi:hypothetical protein
MQINTSGNFINEENKMAYRVLSRYHRPDPSIEWHSNLDLNEELNIRILEMNFTEFHGRKIRTITEPDALTLEVEFIWETQELYEDWASRDIIVQRQQLIDEYNLSVGIIADPKEKIVI